ncbi:hypothetical protein G6F40_016658 [Rhizopus arrhizus]|nr:hypothetical protein G6F40_016658 [Rhizopus arrhizus]
MWNEVQADDIVLIDAHGNKLAGRHEVEPPARFIHAAIHRIAGKACVLHTHMPYATALTLTSDRGLDTTLYRVPGQSRRCRVRRTAGLRLRRSVLPRTRL